MPVRSRIAVLLAAVFGIACACAFQTAAARDKAQAPASSALARGIPKRVAVTRPFTSRELQVDPDTLTVYVAKLADPSFYVSLGGSPEAELVSWTASEKLGQLGPGVIPVLVERVSDPDPFVRERVQEALLHATQDDRVLSRTNGEYLNFFDHLENYPRAARAWWAKFRHFWAAADRR